MKIEGYGASITRLILLRGCVVGGVSVLEGRKVKICDRE